MARKTKATSQLDNARRKAQKSGLKEAAVSDVERITAFLANTVDFPSESFGEEVRDMLQQGFAAGCCAETEHQYVTDVERMVEDVARDAQHYIANALGASDGEIQKVELEIQTLNASRQGLVEAANAACTDFEAKREAYNGKKAMVSRAEADKTVTARALASSSKAQKFVMQEKIAVTEVIHGYVHVLLEGTTEDTMSKSEHVKTVVQLMKDIGAEASLVASIPGVFSVAPADRNEWHNITIDAMKQLLDDAVAKLDDRVAAANLDFTASEAEDMGAAALIDHFNAQVLEACADCNEAEQGADIAQSTLQKQDKKLSGLAEKAGELKCEQMFIKNKVEQVDAVLSSLEYVRARHQRRAAEEAEASARAEAMAKEATEMATPPFMEVEASEAVDGACDTETPVGDVTSLPCDDTVVHKLDLQPAVVCRTALGA